ncbi:MAG TPA: hypothetical protein DFH96_02455 [Bacteroidetes bacterium]|nr:hypothetical protein [Bacteroidota bacterium]
MPLFFYLITKIQVAACIYSFRSDSCFARSGAHNFPLGTNYLTAQHWIPNFDSLIKDYSLLK